MRRTMSLAMELAGLLRRAAPSRLHAFTASPRCGGLWKLSPVCRMSTMAAGQVNAERSRRVFADHVFYKGKCAMNMRLTRPTFKVSEAGDAILAKEGCLMLEFAPAISQRQYDWSKKQLFALSVAELGQILSMTPSDSLEFFHDPNMGKSEAGTVRKSFKIEPTSDKSGYFFSLNVTNKSDKTEARLNIPILKGEFFVLRSAANYALPFLMGLHYVTDPSKVEEAISGTSTGFASGAPRSLVEADSEWDK